MYIKIDNRKIHFKKFGRGRPIVFVHGWGGSMYSLHELATIASKKHTVYIIDLPGFGKSDNPPPHWGVEGYAELVAYFMKEMKLADTIYFGHSFGGEIGIYLASYFPNQIGTLILCNSAFKREIKISPIAKILKKFPAPLRKKIGFVEPLVKRVYYKLFHRHSDLMKFPRLESNFRKIITQDLSREAASIRKPTLILWGEADSYTPVLWAYELEHLIPSSRLVIFPNSGHNLPIVLPQEVWQHIDAFLKK